MEADGPAAIFSLAIDHEQYNGRRILLALVGLPALYFRQSSPGQVHRVSIKSFMNFP